MQNKYQSINEILNLFALHSTGELMRIENINTTAPHQLESN